MIYIEDRENVFSHQSQNCIIFNISLNERSYLKELSPFYMWGDIPVPYSNDFLANCVKSIWEGLKVFENCDVDINYFKNVNKNLEIRSSSLFGSLRGFRRGVYGDFIYSEQEALKTVYIKSYRWVIENKLYKFILFLRELNNTGYKIVLLDDFKKNIGTSYELPVSTANLIKAYAEGLEPFEDVVIKIPHFCSWCGKRVITWETEEYKFKEIPPSENNNLQGEIEFD